MATVETPADSSAAVTSPPPPSRGWRTTLASTELDTRLLGMLASLAAIWIAFHILSDGGFLTARNLWNLSVQSTSIAIMATGMVLVIVSRNIDLSVGSLLGFLGYTMALVQTDGVIAFFNVEFDLGGLGDSSWIWVIALAFGIGLGAAVGAVRGPAGRVRRAAAAARRAAGPRRSRAGRPAASRRSSAGSRGPPGRR